MFGAGGRFHEGVNKGKEEGQQSQGGAAASEVKEGSLWEGGLKLK